MTQEDKNLLFKELCSRLPYKLMCNVTDYTAEREEDENFDACLLSIERTDSGGYTTFIGAAPEYPIWHNLQPLIKPYRRQMSSMTEEEIADYWKSEGIELDYADKRYPLKNDRHITWQTSDWLNAHHFDYRGLIEKGLALEAPKDMY